jgi:hypothetical protein
MPTIVTEVFVVFLQFLQEDVGIVCETAMTTFFISFPVHCSLIILPFDDINL